MNIFKTIYWKKGQDKLIKIELAKNLSKLSPYLPKKRFFELFSLLMKESCDTARFNLVESIVNLKDLTNLSGYEKLIENL